MAQVRHPGWPATLRDGAVELRPHRLRDARAWSEVRTQNQAWLQPWEPTRPGSWLAAHTPTEYRGLLRALRHAAREGTSLPWAITLEGHFVGQLTISNVVRNAFCSATVGYWVDGRVAGRGVMPTALALATDHCFTAAGLHRLEVNVRPENTASRRVVAKLGFREEALHRGYLHIDGDWRDHVGYALTVEDVAPDGLLARWHRARAARPS